jgi:hypothetical protein
MEKMARPKGSKNKKTLAREAQKLEASKPLEYNTAPIEKPKHNGFIGKVLSIFGK